MAEKLTLDDISDLRAYERERAEFRAHVIALKKRRRVAIGPFITVLFENRDTIRFQIQEMARVEKILSDEAIQTELDIYNPLVPADGTLCCTLFIELTSEEELRLWLPDLVGIERSIELRLPDGSAVSSTPEEQHESQLTRETITASVHYVRFVLSPAQVDSLRSGGTVQLASTHRNYTHVTGLSPETIAELIADLTGASAGWRWLAGPADGGT